MLENAWNKFAAWTHSDSAEMLTIVVGYISGFVMIRATTRDLTNLLLKKWCELNDYKPED